MTRKEYENQLEGMSVEELLGEEYLELLRQVEIADRLDAIESDLDDLDDEELLGQEYLERLCEEEIDRRLAEFDGDEETAAEMMEDVCDE